LGANPLLVQASSGNTSIKEDGSLWIKASGKWLLDAEREEMFVPLSLGTVRDCLTHQLPLPAVCSDGEAVQPLTPSIETFLHAVLPQRVVVHVHSVNSIAFAVRDDAEAQLAVRLGGLRWCLIPYASSGAPLAAQIGRAVAANPVLNVFVLANHGLVVGADTCEEAQALIDEVERRLQAVPRKAPAVGYERLAQLTDATQWRLPEAEALHALGTDAASLLAISDGVLYPCQALFLGRHAPVVPRSVAAAEMEQWIDKQLGVRSFVILEGSGMVVSASIGRAELAMLGGLVQVTQRLPADAPIRYLQPTDVNEVLTAEGQHYRDSAEHV
jgi:rhamnose utilization protein RhaD (predicted bifunctional aldolase and dehydrogenase)